MELFSGCAVSIVIPVFNSRETLSKLCEQLVSELDSLVDLQIVLVDDYSTDGSREVCLEMNARYPATVDVLLLARNFGEHSALLAGIRQASGDYCVVMDDDLQNPPSEVKVLLRQAAKGIELVYARYDQRRHPLYRRLGSLLQDWTARIALKKPSGLYLSSFKVFNSRVAREVCRHQAPEPYLDALLLQSTSSISTVECLHRDRGGGESGYTWRKLVGLWFRLVLGCSVLPVRVVAIASVLLCAASLLQTVGGMAAKPGWPAYTCIMLLLWLLGEYAGRIQRLLLGTPQVVVMRSVKRHRPDQVTGQAILGDGQQHETI
jgi:undecaprenyl-phosphate 4-deoxy-4-formamido-L-arabinose transferase